MVSALYIILNLKFWKPWNDAPIIGWVLRFHAYSMLAVCLGKWWVFDVTIANVKSTAFQAIDFLICCSGSNRYLEYCNMDFKVSKKGIQNYQQSICIWFFYIVQFKRLSTRCWFLHRNLSNFVSLSWNLTTHIVLI